jgi:hypothetical protein
MTELRRRMVEELRLRNSLRRPSHRCTSIAESDECVGGAERYRIRCSYS